MIKFANRFFNISSKKSVISRKTRRPYYLLVVPISAFGLGIWQIRRKQWKESMITQINHYIKEPPVEFNNRMITDTSLPEYTPITLRGIFDHSKEIFLGPRGIIEDNLPQGMPLRSSNVGYNVITPIRLINYPETVLVNRGWIPTDKINSAKRIAEQPSGVIEVQGLVRKTEKRGQFQTRENLKQVSDRRDPSAQPYLVCSRKDIDELSRVMGASPFLIDALFDKSVGSESPIGGQTRIYIRNEHMQYVLTWFGLAVATSLMWLHKYK